MQSIFGAVLTGATCGEACWRAREDTCRCSCGGKNHGALRNQEGEQPARTRKAGAYRWELVAVVPEGTVPSAHSQAVTLHEEITGGYRYSDFQLRPKWRNPDPVALEWATKTQAKWPEVKAAAPEWCEQVIETNYLSTHGQPRLIWRQIDTIV